MTMRIGGAYDHDVEQAVAHFGVGGVSDEVAVDQANAHRAERSKERNIGKVRAAEAALMPQTSGSFSVSAERTKAMIWVSHLKPSANIGRTGRSIWRHVRVSRSLMRPSRLIKPPGMRPPGVGIFTVVDREREEIDALAGLGVGGRRGQHYVFAEASTAAPWACLASFPDSMESCFPPASSTETFVASGFIVHPFGAEGRGPRGYGDRVDRRRPRPRLGTHFAKALVIWKPKFGKPVLEPAPPGAGRAVICGCRAWK